MPLIAGIHPAALGRKSTTASSSGCTPLFLNAEPHSTPERTHRTARFPDQTPQHILTRAPRLQDRPPWHLHRAHTAASIISIAPHSAASFRSAAGMSVYDPNSAPRSLHSRRWPIHGTRSITPLRNSSSAPIGSCMATEDVAPQTLLDVSGRVEEVGTDLVHLVDEDMRGTVYLSP